MFQSALVLGLIYLSLESISSSSSSILSATNPIWTILLGALFFGMRYRFNQWLGVVIGFLGVFITLGFHVDLKIGVLFGILSGAAWGLTTLLINRWGKTLDLWVMTTYQMLIGGLILLGASFLLETPHIDFSPEKLMQQIFVLFFLIVMSSIVQFMTWFYVLQNYDPQKASSYLFLVPFFGVISSYFIWHDTIQWYVLLGGALIALGIYLVNSTWESSPIKTWKRKNRLTNRRLQAPVCHSRVDATSPFGDTYAGNF